MGKKKKLMTWLNNGCYPGTVMFSVGNSYDEIVKYLKHAKHGRDWYDGIKGDKEYFDTHPFCASRRTLLNKKGEETRILFYIFLRDWKFKDWHYCMLAHEILHIGQFFLPDLMDRDREIEAEAYYHTHIMEQCLKHLREL